MVNLPHEEAGRSGSIANPAGGAAFVISGWRCGPRSEARIAGQARGSRIEGQIARLVAGGETVTLHLNVTEPHLDRVPVLAPGYVILHRKVIIGAIGLAASGIGVT